MEAPLLLALRDEFLGRGWSVLRFNFRGVGSSEGEASLGPDEVADAAGALDWLRARYDLPIATAGWSFGGAVAIRLFAQEAASIKACVAIAPSVAAKEAISAGLPPAAELGPLGPLLVIVGANDQHVSPESVRAWVEPIESAELVEMAGVNHFFWARYEELAATIGDWLDEVV